MSAFSKNATLRAILSAPTHALNDENATLLRRCVLLSGGGRTRTNDLQVMSLASYHCSTPRCFATAKLLFFFELAIAFAFFFFFSQFFPQVFSSFHDISGREHNELAYLVEHEQSLHNANTYSSVRLFSCRIILFGVKPGDHRTADIVPHAEDGAGDGGHGIGGKMERG